MNYIAHRVNTIADLKEIPRNYGVEVDLRDSQDDIILAHDPFVDGEKFDAFLKSYQHGTLILNIKSERIEHKVLELLKKNDIKEYFFLDSSFPMIYLLSHQYNEKNVAIRFSEFEQLDTIMTMKHKINWVWVDCFTKLPINGTSFKQLKDAGFKLCLVSPELQGRESDIEAYKKYLKKEGIVFDAICTKVYNISKWEE